MCVWEYLNIIKLTFVWNFPQNEKDKRFKYEVKLTNSLRLQIETILYQTVAELIEQILKSCKI